MYYQVSFGYIFKRRKKLTRLVRLVLTGVRVTNFLNIANLDLIFFTQNTFIDVKTGYVKKLLLTLPPHPSDPPASPPPEETIQICGLTDEQIGRQAGKQPERKVDRQTYKQKDKVQKGKEQKDRCTNIHAHFCVDIHI
jgi:hypothetical protein